MVFEADGDGAGFRHPDKPLAINPCHSIGDSGSIFPQPSQCSAQSHLTVVYRFNSTLSICTASIVNPRPLGASVLLQVPAETGSRQI